MPARHILLAKFSALCLMLCVATCGLWIRSYRKTDVIALEWIHDGPVSLTQNAYSHLTARDVRGCIFFYWDAVDVGEPSQMTTNWPEFKFAYYGTETPHPEFVPDRDSFWHCLGFAWSEINPAHPLTTFPLWPIAVVTSILPILTVLKFIRRRRRLRGGRCLSCGYDMRATPGRCPECGAGEAAHRFFARRRDDTANS